MIRSLLLFSLKNRWVVVALAAALMGVGYACFRTLKIEAYPDIADTNVIVIAKYDGRAAEEVEQQVTIPIERALNNTPHVTDRRSRTIFGLSVVQLNFDETVTDYFARQQVLERIADAELPDGVTTELAPLTTAVGEIFRYVVEAPPTYTPMQLRDLQDWRIVPQLLQVPGIADVVTFGGPLKEFHILTDPAKLRKYNLSLPQVMEAVSKNNQNTGGNLIDRGGQGFAVRGLGVLKTPKDIENIVLTAVDGVPVFLSDVARVEISPPAPSGILGYTVRDAKVDVTGSTEGIVVLRRGENPSEALEALKAKMAELEARELPKGVRLRVLYDRSFLIDHSLETVAHTLFEGISIVIILLVLFLGSFRAALVVTVTIPFALLFAFMLMKLAGIPANLLSLGAIDFGIIVDGACVMVEHLVRRYRSATAEEKRRGIVPLTLSAAQEVGREIFFSVTIIILAYLPILLMQRVEGKLFRPMALTLAFAVVGSMLAALTFIPVLVSFAFKKALDPNAKPLKEHRNIFLLPFEKGYAWLLTRLLKGPKLVLTLGFAVVLVMIGMGARLGTEFLPELDEGSIFLRSFMPSGVTIQENAKIAPKIRSIIAKNYPVDFVITQTGRNDTGTDPFPPNRTEILVGLKDYSTWTDSLRKKDLVARIQTELQNAFPGSFFSSGQPIIDQVMEIVTGSAADLAISVVGNDLDLLREKANRISKIVQQTAGASATNIEQEGPQDQLSIQVNRQAAARYGVNVSDVETMVEAAVGGKDVGTIYDEDRRYDLVIRFTPESRNSIDVIRQLQVPAASGALVPMSELADIKYVQGQTNIYRIDSKRMVTVRTNIRGRDQGGFVQEVQQKIQQQVQIPEGYQVIYGGQYENLERAGGQLLLTIPLTVLVVFLFLYILFRNFQDTLLTLTCILFALGGGIVALLMRGYNFNVSAGVGFVSIFGISVMAGVLLVSALNRATIEGRELFTTVYDISREQLRAIMAIMLVAIIGLVPAATSSGIGSDVQRPLATVIIGGLTSTLIFAPLLIPPLFLLLAQRAARRPKRVSSESTEEL
ncbi:CusA/CzcA family heavy metal efflux RND transporter [Siphonobacter sp. BAB-5385]|uniref:efflux RND transporter permease subunit n=1 Tax=Siphonobacter sp. BAB-5385 TaxID=1864822 RepID=UPI000B9E66BE|nr:CusA/CzcA family heavy metal efflux RND transporter [Siphonobacter sp. BAB-5385]OZI06271.1 CusA/CzcA family heavy metal efflux RND transporter [Siphonobacter sp. BAB-5385]